MVNKHPVETLVNTASLSKDVENLGDFLKRWMSLFDQTVRYWRREKPKQFSVQSDTSVKMSVMVLRHNQNQI